MAYLQSKSVLKGGICSSRERRHQQFGFRKQRLRSYKYPKLYSVYSTIGNTVLPMLEPFSTPGGGRREFQLGTPYRQLPLEDANVIDKGLAVDIVLFEDIQKSAAAEILLNATNKKTLEQKDSKQYTRVCYEVAVGVPIGPEYTVPAPKTAGARFNPLVGECDGTCDGAHWFLGIDEGFAALAGVEFLPSSDCRPNMAAVEQQDVISDKLTVHCGSRCAQTLYDMTAATASRTEPPGYRTIVSQISNWSAWLSCSIYDSVTKWAEHDGPAYAYADTLGKSKIHFVDGELWHVGRPHDSAILQKSPGWESHGSERWIALCEKYGLRGMYEQPNIIIANLIFEVGIYGRSKLAWSIMALDTLFYADYNLFSDTSPCLGWYDHVRNYTQRAIAVPDNYIGSYSVGAVITYGALQVKQRREQEAAKRGVKARRGGIVWENKRLWSSYLSTDAAANQYALLTGGCADDFVNAAISRIFNDVVDLGYDWAVGDIGNGILTLAEGKTEREDLAKAYTKFASVINRMATFRHDTVGAVFNASTHAWQMSNTRHKVLACAMTSDDPGIGPTTRSASWHQAVILNEPGDEIKHEMKAGMLHGTKVELTTRSWAAVEKNAIVGTLLYYGHCWPLQKRKESKVPSLKEIEDVEDILRCACMEATMEINRADLMDAIWSWIVENWCATDLMWHAMIGSTAISADRRIGTDRWDDTKQMQGWQEEDNAK